MLQPICSCSFLRDTDEVSIVTFNNYVHVAREGPLQTLNWRSFRSSTRASGELRGAGNEAEGQGENGSR